MRLGSHLLAGLALGALSISPAVARHHGHATHSVQHHHADSAAQGHDEPLTVTTPDKASDAKDEPRPNADKGPDRDDRHDPRKGDKGGVSKNLSPTGEHEVPPSIDTRITVHQGREPPKHGHWHQFAQGSDPKSKLAGAPGSKRERDRHHREADNKRQRDERRNALGAKIDTDKPKGEQRNAAGLLITPPLSPRADLNTPPTVVPGQDSKITQQGKIQPSRSITPPPPAPTWAKGDSINGADLVRPVVRTGAISGTPKIAGVISGNTVRVRHP